MRILQLTSHLNVGGITTYVVQLAEALARRGHQVVVASGGGALASRCARDPSTLLGTSPPAEAIGLRGLSHWEVPLATSAEFSPQVAWACRGLSRMLSASPVDVIHAHTRTAQVAAAWLSRRHRIPYVTTWHGFFRRRLSRRWWPCTGAMTIAISEPVAAHLRDVFRVPPERIRMIPHGVDAARFEQPVAPAELQRMRAQLQLPPDEPVVGTMARLVPSKGVDQLLEAFGHVRAKIPQARFVIVGDGAERTRLEQHAARLKLSASVRFAGTMPDTRAILSLMDVFVFMPAMEEGFGLSLLEAMASGRPIVAVRRGGGASWVLDRAQEEMLVVEPDPARIGEAVAGLLRDTGEAARLSSKARQAAKSTYDFARVVEQVEDVYHAVR